MVHGKASDHEEQRGYAFKPSEKEGKAKYALLVAATIGAVIGFNLLFELLGVTNKSEAYTEVAAQQYSAHFIVGILVFGFISPIAEELLFRGVIYGYLRRFMDIKLAIALSALIFGVYHMNYVQGIYGFLIGCLMAYAYEYFGEFKMAVFVHVASNVLAYCLSYTAIAVTGFVSWPVCVISWQWQLYPSGCSTNRKIYLGNKKYICHHPNT